MAIVSDIPPDQQQQPSPFPSELPVRPTTQKQTWKDRNCPNMRTCWHFSFRSYNPRHCPDKRTLFRRLAMIWILFLRTGMSILVLVFDILTVRIAGIVIDAILLILGFWFVGWCLAVIGDAVGERRVFGKLIGRKHIDIFLYGIAIIHTGMVALWVFEWNDVIEQTTWVAMGLLIFLGTWICTWPPEYPPTYV